MTISVDKDPNRKFCQECDGQVCDNEQSIRVRVANTDFVLDYACAEGLYMALGQQLGFLTVNGLVNMAYGTAKAAGWHDKDHIPVTPMDPHSHIAAMMMLLLPWANAVEAIRKPAKLNVREQLAELAKVTEAMHATGPTYPSTLMMENQNLEPWQMRLLGWLGLKVTELVEAAEAVINRDKDNFAEELADEKIRIGDTVGAINDDPAHPFNGIDLEAAILEKNARNKARGYRHQNDTGTPKLA